MIKTKLFQSKNAQSEIIGIAIVMVLIMIGLVFVINFVILPSDSENIKVIYDRSQMAANTLTSLLKTTSSCNKLTITELIQDCAENYNDPNMQYQCPVDALLTTSCNAQTCRSCQYLNESLQYLFTNSINTMKMRYDFYICRWSDMDMKCMSSSPGDIMTYIGFNSCQKTNAPSLDAKQVPIPTGDGNRVAQIYVCNYESLLV